jgi:hypothetical protein
MEITRMENDRRIHVQGDLWITDFLPTVYPRDSNAAAINAESSSVGALNLQDKTLL